jgi:hypothetical protein
MLTQPTHGLVVGTERHIFFYDVLIKKKSKNNKKQK